MFHGFTGHDWAAALHGAARSGIRRGGLITGLLVAWLLAPSTLLAQSDDGVRPTRGEAREDGASPEEADRRSIRRGLGFGLGLGGGRPAPPAERDEPRPEPDEADRVEPGRGAAGGGMTLEDVVAALGPDAPVEMLASQVYRDAVAKIRPSMVTIETFGGLSRPTEEVEQRSRMTGFARPGEGPTTGLIVSEDGLIATSTYNFIRRPRAITVRLADGTGYVAELVARDETRKIAILRIETNQVLPTPERRDRDTLRIGETALSVGVGFGGDEPATSVGIISAPWRISGKAVQTDANISPANYGGPLIDMEGRLIGMCVPLSPQAGDTAAGVEWYDSGIGFAAILPTDPAWLERLASGESIQPGQLGVNVGPPAPGLRGITITRVPKRSAAAKAGIKRGDTIVEVAGLPTRHMGELRAAMGSVEAGQVVEVVVQRKDKKLRKQVKLGAPPQSEEDRRSTPRAPREASPRGGEGQGRG